jgi:hypothetical protein
MNETFYRYDDVQYAAPADEMGDSTGFGSLEVHLSEYTVARRTPKGVWLDGGFGAERFMLTAARKRFACPTEAEARESFIARKRKQIRIYMARIERAKRAIEEIGRKP